MYVASTKDVLADIARSIWKDFLRPLLIFLVKAFAVCLALCIIAYIVMLFMAHSAIKKMTDPDNTEFQTFASAIPLFCTAKEIEENEEEFALLADFANDVERKKNKCTNSLGDAWDCASEAWSALDDTGTYKKAYQKGKRLNRARKKVKGIIERTVKRIKAIEPYDENSAELKKDALSLAVYINNNANAWDVAINSERIVNEIGRRGDKIFEKDNLKKISKHIWDKYPQSIVLIFDPVYKIFADEDSLKEAAWRSKTFREAMSDDGCLTNIYTDNIAPARFVGFAALMGMMQKDEPTEEADDTE